MANPQHLSILRQGVDVWNRWRQEHSEVDPNLQRAKLSAAKLSKADLKDADLTEADLTFAKLDEANLMAAKLKRADLENASLSGAHLMFADLSAATLSVTDLSFANLSHAKLNRASMFRANLFWAHLSKANLTNTDLRWATLNSVELGDAHLTSCAINGTIFANVDLSVAKGLEMVTHEGPSTIGIDTIYRSKGNIPEVFLRGAGVPDQFIEYARSLITQPIQYYSCFICHSRKDQSFCNRLYADLQANHLRVWYFPEDATWGKPVWGEINGSIRIYDKLLLVCSAHSLQSAPVLREIERALQREDQEGKNVLFPIDLDGWIFDKWEHERKADVLAKVIGDFRGWDTDARSYETSLNRLLRALQEED